MFRAAVSLLAASRLRLSSRRARGSPLARATVAAVTKEHLPRDLLEHRRQTSALHTPTRPARSLERRPHRWRRSSLRSAVPTPARLVLPIAPRWVSAISMAFAMLGTSCCQRPLAPGSVPGPDSQHGRPLGRCGLGDGRNRTLAADKRRSPVNIDRWRSAIRHSLRRAASSSLIRCNVSAAFVLCLAAHQTSLPSPDEPAADARSLRRAAHRPTASSVGREQGRTGQNRAAPTLTEVLRLGVSASRCDGQGPSRNASLRLHTRRTGRRRPTSRGFAPLVTYAYAVSEVTAVVLRIA